MIPDPRTGTPAPLDPASPAMGERIVEAWRRGALVLPLGEDDATPLRLPGLHRSALPPSLSGQARVSLAGVGERFGACRVTPQGDEQITDTHRTRLWLNDATRQVLATGLGLLAPVWVASVLTAIALVIMLLTRRALTKTAAEAN